MLNMNSEKVLSKWFSIMGILGLAIVIQGCATAPNSIEINNSLPPEKIAIYNDSFDTIRSVMWDRAGMVFNEKQLPNFKLADMRIENGQLVVETKIGAFSK